MARAHVAYRWTLRYDDPLMADAVVTRVRETVGTWLELHPGFFSEGWTTDSTFGLIQVGITVTHRDQWAVQRKMREFARALAIRARVTMIEVIMPESAKLPPHEHRGRRAVEAHSGT